MRRGDVYRYQPVVQREAQSNLRLIVSDDAINANDQLPTVFAMHVVADDPGGLLAVRIDEFGWAFALEIDRPLRRRLVDKLGEATAEEMEAVDNALRATFNL
ncbi:type II toxin-antitoxin system PemK/MazF family toxin [Pseudonocardia acaciae]|uniref:type II toxin-antitoxin system PemK/MazF family toxin n=1 Tax=Pseudonocardia acaciae TaxID=551276 RepID=UPI00048E3E1C|nr:type II toxin-antitoxin system PemK/MazF family toxin [Pseudonocardia acaciae]